MSMASCGSIGRPKASISAAHRVVGKMTENDDMEIQGRLHNGVVVLEGDLPLPEGTMVTVSYPAAPPAESPETHRRVQLPLVRSDRPGSRRLTAERVAELLEDDDVSA